MVRHYGNLLLDLSFSCFQNRHN